MPAVLGNSLPIGLLCCALPDDRGRILTDGRVESKVTQGELTLACLGLIAGQCCYNCQVHQQASLTPSL